MAASSRWFSSFAVLLVLSPACDGSPADGDGDADADTESGLDADADVDDDHESDADLPEVPLPGFGELMGACGVLDDDEWGAPATPFIFRNAIDFGAVAFDESLLSAGGYEIWEEGNLGGSSVESEIISYEVLYRCELASLELTEGEIVYQDSGGKKTDTLVTIDSRAIGVSVTRAYHYPPEESYTLAEATDLLNDKLADVLLSAANAAEVNAWERSILHIIAYDTVAADAIEAAYTALDAAVQDATIVVVTVTEGEDEFVY